MAEFREVMRNLNEICSATSTCADCPIQNIACVTVSDDDAKRIEEIALNWKSETDWSNVEVDTKILVKDYKGQAWEKRYFAKYENGRVYAYDKGGTSWNTDTSLPWRFAKIWRGEE